VVVLIVVLVGAAYVFLEKQYYCFDADMIEQAQKDIRDKFTKSMTEEASKPGMSDLRVENVDVGLIKESCKKLTGYVKVRVRVKKETREYSRNCSATMGEGSTSYIWRCGE
jgi:hypothetical protein